MHDPTQCRFIRAASAAYNKSCTIVVVPTEGGSLECRIEGPAASEQRITKVLKDRGAQYVRTDGGEGGSFAFVIEFEPATNIIDMFLRAQKSVSDWAEFENACFWFQFEPGRFGPVQVLVRNNGTYSFHDFTFMVATENIGDRPEQIAAGWQTELLECVTQSVEVEDFEMKVIDADEFAIPGYDPVMLHVIVVNPSPNPLDDMLSLVQFLPWPNGMLADD